MSCSVCLHARDVARQVVVLLFCTFHPHALSLLLAMYSGVLFASIWVTSSELSVSCLCWACMHALPTSTTHAFQGHTSIFAMHASPYILGRRVVPTTHTASKCLRCLQVIECIRASKPYYLESHGSTPLLAEVHGNDSMRNCHLHSCSTPRHVQHPTLVYLKQHRVNPLNASFCWHVPHLSRMCWALHMFWVCPS